MAIYLKFPHIKKGESNAKGHEGDKGWMEILNFGYSCSRYISTPVGASSKREASAPAVNEVRFAKLMDSTGPLWMQESLIGTPATAQIDVTKTGKNQLLTFVEVTLTGAMVSGYSSLTHGDRPTESIILNFTKLQVKYTPFDDSFKAGTPVVTWYDIAAAANA